MIPDDTPLSHLGVPHVGRVCLAGLAARGVVTIADYLQTDNDLLRDARYISDAKIAHLDAFIAGLGYDTKARWWLQYKHYSGTYVSGDWRSGEQNFFHILRVANTWDKRPTPLCRRPIQVPYRSDHEPGGRTHCAKCWDEILWESKRHAH